LGVIEKQVLKTGIKQAQVRNGRLSQERQVSALLRLDDPSWNFLHHGIHAIFSRAVDWRRRSRAEPLALCTPKFRFKAIFL
jgi:hypothetical protein